jgi:AcrR family transcriptional regulator
MALRKSAAVAGAKKKQAPSLEGTLSARNVTADRIVAAATRLFADKGFDGTSVKDISDTAGVNIAAINYHFGTKDSLCRHIIDQFGSERLDLARKTLQAPRNADDFKVRLEIFLRQTLEAMIRQTDIVRLVQQELDKPDSRCSVLFRNTFMKHTQTLVEFFEHARKNGIVAADVEPFSASAFLMSHIFHQTRNDAVLKKFSGHSLSDEKYRNRWILQTLRIFTDGVIAKDRGA